MNLPTTADRVAQHTPVRVNKKIEEQTQSSISYYRNHPEQIEQRLKKLDKEWDIERALETNAATLIIASSVLGFVYKKRLFALPLVVGTFLLQHALQGWCPPLSVMRRLGIRTATEIEQERAVLKGIIESRN